MQIYRLDTLKLGRVKKKCIPKRSSQCMEEYKQYMEKELLSVDSKLLQILTYMPFIGFEPGTHVLTL